MRLRNIAGAIKEMNQHPLVNQKPEEYKGKWHEFFGNNNPIYIEIGMGKGDFVINNALKFKNINFIGIEKFSAVILRAVQKVESFESPIKNLCLLRFDAVYLQHIFAENEIARVYLNFSDPWHKERYAKRRLTYSKYLNKYKTILPTGGLVRFKSDNDKLFEYSLKQIEESTFKLNKMTRDLHTSEYVVNNIMTEYEAKFVSNGETINFVEIENVKI